MAAPHGPTDQQQRNARLDRFLSRAALLLIAIFLVIVGVGAIVGLSEDFGVAAVDNYPQLYIATALLMAIAVGLAIWSLFQNGESSGNRNKAWLLVGSTAAFAIGVLLVTFSVHLGATGGGRPNLSDVSVRPNSLVEVSFHVHADGVKNGKMIIAEVGAYRDKIPVGNDLAYRAVLRPNEAGKVDGTVSFSLKPNGANRLTIRARPDHGTADGADCDPSQAQEKLTCATVLLPE
ncbi:hypothetical protein [Kitasatospora sp. NPDC005856]|uniref:hypothetical protein n=1 Tax=Kitasatospora sp. NPDC005856 TaxID=3154566 RepID=UPI003410738A